MTCNLKFLEVSDIDATVKFFTALLFRIGAILIHISCVPSTTVNLILFQHLVDFAVVTLSYFFVGLPISLECLGVHAVSGNTTTLEIKDDYAANLLTGWAVALISSGILSLALAGRGHSIGNAITAFLFLGVIQPGFIKLCYQNDEKSSAFQSLFVGNRTFQDDGGSGVVHTLIGTFCLVAITAYGNQIITLPKVDDSSIPAGSHSILVTGYLFIVTGLVGLILPDSSNRVQFNNTLTNAILAYTSASLISLISYGTLVDINYWTSVKALQGSLAGLITVSSGLTHYDQWSVILFSVMGSLLFFFFSSSVSSLYTKDFTRVIFTHLLCGVLSLLLVPVSLQDTLSKSPSTILSHIADQAIYIVVIVVIGGGTSLVTFGLLYLLGILKNQREKEANKESKLVVQEMKRNKLHFEKNLTAQPGSHTIYKLQQEIRNYCTNQIKNVP